MPRTPPVAQVDLYLNDRISISATGRERNPHSIEVLVLCLTHATRANTLGRQSTVFPQRFFLKCGI